MFRPRFVGRISAADSVTVVNAMLGFAAAAFALVDPGIAARMVLLAAVADGLDGVLARKVGSTRMGEYLDSLADVASFCVAPALVVAAVVFRDLGTGGLWGTTGIIVPALFVGMGVVRLALYTAYDAGTDATEGVQTTLAATVIAVATLADLPFVSAEFLLVATAVFAYLMVTQVPYPDLYARDALIMGVVQAGAILAPDAFGAAFPRALLVAALAYLVGGPVFYWRRPDG